MVFALQASSSFEIQVFELGQVESIGPTYDFKSSLYSRYYALACYERRGLSPRLRSQATQLRRNVAAKRAVNDTLFDLNDPGFEPQTYRFDRNVSTTELIERRVVFQIIQYNCKAMLLKCHFFKLSFNFFRWLLPKNLLSANTLLVPMQWIQ